MWASLWCEAVSHAWGASSKIVGCFDCYVNFTSPNLHICYPYLKSFRAGWSYCKGGGEDRALVHSCDVLLRRVIHLPNVLTSTEQEHDHHISGSVFFVNPYLAVMAFNCEVSLRCDWCNGLNHLGLLDSKHRPADFCHFWWMPWNMDGFFDLSLQRSLASCQALGGIGCHALVRTYDLIEEDMGLCFLILGVVLRCVPIPIQGDDEMRWSGICHVQ